MFNCKYCKSEKYELKENLQHHGLYCADCGRWQKWVSIIELERYKYLNNIQGNVENTESKETYLQKRIKEKIFYVSQLVGIKTALIREQDDIINSECPFGLELTCTDASYFTCCQCWHKKVGEGK